MQSANSFNQAFLHQFNSEQEAAKLAVHQRAGKMKLRRSPLAIDPLIGQPDSDYALPSQYIPSMCLQRETNFGENKLNTFSCNIFKELHLKIFNAQNDDIVDSIRTVMEHFNKTGTVRDAA